LSVAWADSLELTSGHRKQELHDVSHEQVCHLA
jgi:hypothetical protein